MWFLGDELRDRFFDAAGRPSRDVPCHVGPMPIEAPPAPTATRDELRRQLGIEGTTLLFLGRLVPVKGVAALLQAVAELSEPVAIRIAGDGPERQRLFAQAQRLGVDATFEGWVSGTKKEALLRACDAIVVPSEPRDGLPVVLFEARARGLPIIATGSSATLQRQAQLSGATLVPALDRAALCQAIDTLRRERDSLSQGVTLSVPRGGR
jgi:glycosyltransferase involved in cell wall biosynthesis